MDLKEQIKKANPNAEFSIIGNFKTKEEYLRNCTFESGERPEFDHLVFLATGGTNEGYKLIKYKTDRKNSYPSIAEQLDNIFHNGIDAWKADIQAIKDQFPKP